MGGSEYCIKLGDATKVLSDLLLLKHAQDFYGADATVSSLHTKSNLCQESDLQLSPDDFSVIDTQGTMAPARVMFLGTPPLPLPVLHYEKDPVRRQPYLDSLRFTWAQVRPDRNPLWNYISAASGAGRLTADAREESLLTLRRIPLDLVEWTVDNGHRQDLKLRTGKDRFGEQEILEVLDPDERPVQKWNANPYRLAGGGGGQREDDGTFFLLPYRMGRYHGWVR